MGISKEFNYHTDGTTTGRPNARRACLWGLKDAAVWLTILLNWLSSAAVVGIATTGCNPSLPLAQAFCSKSVMGGSSRGGALAVGSG